MLVKLLPRVRYDWQLKQWYSLLPGYERYFHYFSGKSMIAVKVMSE